jgi:aminoglycoside 3-N-acetyltransferase
MPTFSYKATRGEVFDVNHTETTLGVLPEHFRKQKGVIRSLHPIFSFAAWGKGAKKILALKDFDCFGEKSVFGKLYGANATYMLFGIDMQKSATFIYYSEQKYGVPYRNFENFRETIRQVNKTLTKNIRYFVRNRSIAIDDNFYKLEERALEAKVAKSFSYACGKILIMKARGIDGLIQDELRKDIYFLITRPPNLL